MWNLVFYLSMAFLAVVFSVLIARKLAHRATCDRKLISDIFNGPSDSRTRTVANVPRHPRLVSTQPERNHQHQRTPDPVTSAIQ